MTVFEAYITNLGKYAEGQLVGETLKFPATTEEVQSLLKNIGVDGVRYYSTTIENTTLYWYTDNGVLTSEQNTSLSPEDAAYELAVLFMDDLKAEKEGKTFRVMCFVPSVKSFAAQ